MIAFYSPRFNIDLGLLNRLHPFDGRKFAKVHDAIEKLGVQQRAVTGPVSEAQLDAFAGEILRPLYASKRYILRALEVPYIPLVPFRIIDRRVLEPMRWAVQGTIAAAEQALAGANCWNLSGGYHHASRNAAEGFCVYNDVGIAVQDLRGRGLLGTDERIMIVDVDAHHGNGNAHVFLKDTSVEILDIYNADIYPNSPSTKRRVDVGIPLASSTRGDEYLAKLRDGLGRLKGGARIAFVIAGTDVLASDPLGALGLSVDECAERDRLVFDRLKMLGVPAVFLAGGGYGKDSARAMIAGIAACRDPG
ncbi:MAG: histone deacetylase [Pseudomonadota bacterium]|nr:histone deacetylase [Pseudomonadota bacterium]